MEEPRATILITDDEDSVRNGVLRKMRSEGYDCVGAASGKEALEAASTRDFDLLLLDIKMPGMSGMEVLAQMTAEHPDTAVVMVTAAAGTETAIEAMKLGAYDFIVKPFDLNDLSMRVQRALERKRLILENREYQLRLEQKIEQQVGEIQEYYREAIQALAREGMALEKSSELPVTEESADSENAYSQMANALMLMTEMREPYLHGHPKRVSLFANEIALQLCCPEELIREIGLAAIVHDIGKIVIPESILFKPGQLTPQEYSEVQKYPAASVAILRNVDYFKDVLTLVESQHEWYNGEGYPNKLEGENIPLGARILAVADAYDAMTSPRPHRPHLSNPDAIQTLKKGAGEQWDPVVVDAFLQILERDYTALKT